METTSAKAQSAPNVRTAFAMVREVAVHRVDDAREAKRWDELLACHHYLGPSRLVGETMRYFATLDGQPVALVGFSSAALKVTVRDQFIGWQPEQQSERLKYIANNARFVILPGYNVPNMGSHVLGLALRRLSDDWRDVHGHPILACETFVDPARFQGTVYLGTGFTYLGTTTGFGRKNTTYVAHDQPKMMLIRPLRRRALEMLRQDFLTPELLDEGALVDPNSLPLTGKKGLMAFMARVPDPRHRRGVRHNLASTLAISVLGLICGMRGFRAIGQWAQGLTQEQRARLGCFRSPSSGLFVAPSVDTVRRTLTQVDPDALSREAAAYLESTFPSTRPLALDGKTRKNSASHDEAQRHLLGVIRHGLISLVAQADVGEKENEIPVAQRVLQTIPLQGAIVTADALHTQVETARQVVEQGGEYVFTVKANQPSLHQTLAALDWRFSPSVTTRDKDHGRIETRTIQTLHIHDGLGFPHVEQAARVERITERPKSVIDPHTHCRVRESTTTREVAFVITSLYPEQAGPEQILALVRGHWSIEAMHHIQDVTYDEDRSRIRTRHGPANVTTLTRMAMAIIRHLGFRTVPDGQRLLANDRDGLIRRLVA